MVYLGSSSTRSVPFMRAWQDRREVVFSESELAVVDSDAARA